MTKDSYTFEPITSSLNWTMTISGLISIVSLLLLYYFYTKKVPYSRKKEIQVISLLLSFVIVIGLGSTFFSWLSTKKIKTVEITSKKLATPYGETKLKNIKSAYIHLDAQKSAMSPGLLNDTMKLLIIEEFSGKTHALSEENYKIIEIISALKTVLPDEK